MSVRQVYTASYFTRGIPPSFRRMAISQSVPKWWQEGTFIREERLMPTWRMLNATPEQYDASFGRWLAKQDAEALWLSLPEKCVLLCWEQPGVKCHRRLIAEWFENEIGVLVPEWGEPREKTLAYAAMPLKAKEEQQQRETQLRLF